MKIRHSKILYCILLLGVLLKSTALCNVILPKLISNGMILQRDVPLKIYGWADPGENIAIEFIDSIYNTQADKEGNWNVLAIPHKAGGPFTLKITGNNEIIIKDILLGDVWICSGQSNMELPMSRISWIYPDEIANCDNENIRQFLVDQTYNFDGPQKDIPGGEWKKANQKNIDDFSGVAYFFAKELYTKHQVPIGLINNALGGSPAEAWLSKEALKSFPHYLEEAEKFKDTALINKIRSEDKARIREWNKVSWLTDEGSANHAHKWSNSSVDVSDWPVMHIPGYWTDTDLNEINGVVWFRKEIEVPASMVGKEALLVLGRIVDADSTFINGKFVGTVSYQYPPRRYNVPAGILKEGKNTITVRLISNNGTAGFVPDKIYELIAGDDSIHLEGNWKYHIGSVMAPLGSLTFIRWKPEGLYNAILAPLCNYKVKGVIWYQGESNTRNPKEYKALLPALISDWRTSWNQPDLPFIVIQLSNFMEAKAQPDESNWAELRDVQKDVLTIPNTGLVVTIDLGEWNDIHPLNKKDVGIRTALSAEKVAYGDNKVIYSGPVYKSMEIEDNKIIISFDNIGSGLMVKGDGELKEFAIASDDKKFVWATAIIKDNKVVVWNDAITNPTIVRYAWADNPDKANLYNMEGIPASPFTTEK